MTEVSLQLLSSIYLLRIWRSAPYITILIVVEIIDSFGAVCVKEVSSVTEKAGLWLDKQLEDA